MRVFIIVATCFFLVSCATAPVSEYSYEKGVIREFPNELLVDRPFDEVWDDLVGELATTFYVINNIDKESRLLNVSFSESNKPSKFIDCGKTRRSFELDGNLEVFKYDVADNSQYKLTSGKVNGVNTWYYLNDRKTNLTGRANIYVAPTEDGTTKITVNARYVWGVTVTAQEINYHKPSGSHFYIGRPQVAHQGEVAFNSKTIGEDGQGITCISNGLFERDILSILE